MSRNRMLTDADIAFIAVAAVIGLLCLIMLGLAIAAFVSQIGGYLA